MNPGEERATVVIIDDVPLNIQLMESFLSDDYIVRFATNGPAGIRLVRGKLPDIVLLDVMMPGMDGYEVCAALKEDPETKDIPIILVTAMDEAGEEARGLSIGVVDYITKPFAREIIRARIKVHIELKRMRDRLARMSVTDGLTGLGNRRFFDELLEREWSRSVRSGLPVSLLMADIDYFKGFNDCHGHPAGDDCLRRVAQGLVAGVPRNDGDLVARFGGEEFAVILVDTGIEGTRTVAERLLSNVRELAILHGRSPVSDVVTVSIGFATVVPIRGQEPRRLIELADEMLYRAKDGGRNRAVG